MMCKGTVVAYIALLLGYTFSVLKIKKMKWEGAIQDSLWSRDQFEGDFVVT